MKKSDIWSWIDVNHIKAPFGHNLITLVFLTLFSHLGRAVILVYMSANCKLSKIPQILTKKILQNHYHTEVWCDHIGRGFRMPHPKNIIINARTIGDNVQINHNTTLGANMRKSCIVNEKVETLPTIGNNVIIHAGAVVAGPIVVGNHCLIGANCVVTHSLESHSMVYNKVQISEKKVVIDDGQYSLCQL